MSINVEDFGQALVVEHYLEDISEKLHCKVASITHSGPPERKGLVVGKTCKIIIASGGTYDAGLPAAASDHESGYLKRVLAFIGITDVTVVLAGGTAAVSFKSTTLEALAAQFRPAILAAAH